MARDDGDKTVLGVIVGLVALGAVATGVKAGLRWVHDHPAWAGLVVVGVVLVVALVVASVVSRRRAAEARLAELERSIASADGLSGPEFERWMARLMTRTGFRSVTVQGGADDQGADITAYTPDGRWVVVQCKRYAPSRSVGSPAVHAFSGPAHQIHGAQLAVLVTTSRFTAPAVRDANPLNVVLIDRTRLAAWAADRAVPDELGGGIASVPA